MIIGRRITKYIILSIIPLIIILISMFLFNNIQLNTVDYHTEIYHNDKLLELNNINQNKFQNIKECLNKNNVNFSIEYK